jgi:hypothetical protein
MPQEQNRPNPQVGAVYPLSALLAGAEDMDVSDLAGRHDSSCHPRE